MHEYSKKIIWIFNFLNIHFVKKYSKTSWIFKIFMNIHDIQVGTIPRWSWTKKLRYKIRRQYVVDVRYKQLCHILCHHPRNRIHCVCLDTCKYSDPAQNDRMRPWVPLSEEFAICRRWIPSEFYGLNCPLHEDALAQRADGRASCSFLVE